MCNTQNRNTNVRKVRVVTLWGLRSAVGSQQGAGRPHSAPPSNLVEFGAFLGITMKTRALIKYLDKTILKETGCICPTIPIHVVGTPWGLSTHIHSQEQRESM